jgi:hypothetical protein
MSLVIVTGSYSTCDGHQQDRVGLVCATIDKTVNSTLSQRIVSRMFGRLSTDD